MKFFKRMFNKNINKRMVVLSLEGLGLPLANGGGGSGRLLMPYLAGLLTQGACAPLAPIQPIDSHQAWASYMTGVNPGVHGIMGFLDRIPNPFEVVVNDATRLRAVTLWALLNMAGRKVGVMNVPCTFPPAQVDGFMMGGLLSPSLSEGAYPFDLGPKLQELEYRIDCDTALAMENPLGFLADASQTLNRRIDACLHLMKQEEWDFVQLHISSCDRVNHFLWDSVSGASAEFGTECAAFYRLLDQRIADFMEHLPSDTGLAIISEHGFAASKAQVFLNHWLISHGYLTIQRGGRNLAAMHPDSKAYCLHMGRIYLNRQGREEMGSVKNGEAAELKDELANRLSALQDPSSRQPIVARVWRAEELYAGPRVNRAADLIVEPNPGFDLRANLDAPETSIPVLGMGAHQAEGAFFYLKGASFNRPGPVSILDAAPTILSFLGLPVPHSLEGTSLL